MHIIILIIVSLWYYPTYAYFEGSNYNLQLPITDTALNSCFYAPTKDFITHCGLKIDKYNNTIFHALAKNPQLSNPIIQKNKNELTELLDSIGSNNINAKDRFRRTPLYYAIKCNNEPFARILLQNHANPQIMDDSSQFPPMHNAAHHNQTGIMKIFLEQYKMDPNEVCQKNNRTPISILIFWMHKISINRKKDCSRIVPSARYKKYRDNNEHLESYIPSIIVLLNAGAIIQKEDRKTISEINHPHIKSLFKNHMIINAWLSKNRSTHISLQKTTWFRKMTTIFQKKPTLFAHRIFSRYPLPQEIIEAKINMK